MDNEQGAKQNIVRDSLHESELKDEVPHQIGDFDRIFEAHRLETVGCGSLDGTQMVCIQHIDGDEEIDQSEITRYGEQSQDVIQRDLAISRHALTAIGRQEESDDGSILGI